MKKLLMPLLFLMAAEAIPGSAKNLEFGGHHSGPSFPNRSSEIVQEYSPRRDSENLGHSEASKFQVLGRSRYTAQEQGDYAKVLGGAMFLQNTPVQENKPPAIEENKPTPQVQEQSAKDRRCASGMNFYARIFGGANFLQNTTIDENKTSYQTGYIFAGSLGYCWRRSGLRLEAEYAFRRNAISKIHFVTQGFSEHGHFQTSSYMGNLLWDFPLCSWGCRFWKLQPFIGAGMGYDFQKVHSSNSRIDFHQKWGHFAWQAMVGLSYPIFRHAAITLEYQFHQGGSHFYNHSVGLGLVYKFGFIR